MCGNPHHQCRGKTSGSLPQAATESLTIEFALTACKGKRWSMVKGLTTTNVRDTCERIILMDRAAVAIISQVEETFRSRAGSSGEVNEDLSREEQRVCSRTNLVLKMDEMRFDPPPLEQLGEMNPDLPSPLIPSNQVA